MKRELAQGERLPIQGTDARERVSQSVPASDSTVFGALRRGYQAAGLGKRQCGVLWIEEFNGSLEQLHKLIPPRANLGVFE